MADENKKSDPPIENPEGIIQRLISEQNHTRNLLDEIKKELSSDSEFAGLSLVGGIRSLIRRYREEKTKVEKLNKELDQMLRGEIIKRNNKA